MLKRIMPYLHYPILLTVFISIGTNTIVYHQDLEAALSMLGQFLMGYLILFEVILPYKGKLKGKEILRDLCFYPLAIVVNIGVNVGLTYVAMRWFATDQGMLAQLPVWAMVVIILVVGDFGVYWWHRVEHEGGSDFLWRLHAAHHTPRQLHALMATVEHPLNTVVALSLRFLPIGLLGCNAEAIFIYGLINAFIGLTTHANIEIKSGFLRHIFQTQELHRFHHSAKLEEAKNYSALLTLWDRVFGTYYYKPDTAEEIGLVDYNGYPEDVWNLLLDPFRYMFKTK